MKDMKHLLFPQSNTGRLRGAVPIPPHPTPLPKKKKKKTVEKVCLAPIFFIQKLRHYLQHHYTKLNSWVDSLNYILNWPTLHGRLAKWTVLLQQYDIEYVSEKAIKWKALPYFLATHLVLVSLTLATYLPNKEGVLVDSQKGCEMFFDGASEAQWGHNKKMHRIMFQESKAHLFHQAMHLYHTPFPSSFSLTTGCSNNMTKYEAIIAGIK